MLYENAIHLQEHNVGSPEVILVEYLFIWNVFKSFIFKALIEMPLTTPVLLQIAVLISLGFIGCWTPYGLVSLWSIFRDSGTIPPEVSLLPCMFAKSSTVYNPLIYYMFSQSFKKEVKQLKVMCVGYNACRVSNSINDNSIYMVAADMTPKIAARSTLQEITESKMVTLEWRCCL